MRNIYIFIKQLYITYGPFKNAFSISLDRAEW
jgi:hypothetical protein